MNPSYPFYFNIDPDQTNLNEAQDRYRPGQLFWRRNQSENHQQKKLGLKRPYLYEGSEENDPLSIISCIHVKNIEIKTKE